MRRTWWLLPALAALLGPVPARAQEQGALDLELWTNRGNEAVYRDGEALEVKVRSSEDGYLLVYDIDAEGRVRLLWPDVEGSTMLEGRRTLTLPTEDSPYDLVVSGPTGVGYVVAIVSLEPFRSLPWYLQPYGAEGDADLIGNAEDEDGVSPEGRIVGDPFVAMERIRRRVLRDPEAPDAFGTAYTSYYVHDRVAYPRYLCNDCHRSSYWAWWDGFDPYYARCSVFDFRVNYVWSWGPSYWYGFVPYYVYVYRHDCPPRYRFYSTRYVRHSSWDGWSRWTSMWGGSLRRYKSAPPADYVPPSRYKGGMLSSRGGPPGFQRERPMARGRLAIGPGARERGGPITREWTRLRDSEPRRPIVERGRLRDSDPGRPIVERGRLRDSDPGRQVVERGRLRDPEARGRDSETRDKVRGMPDRDRGGLRWVGRRMPPDQARRPDWERDQLQKPRDRFEPRLERPWANERIREPRRVERPDWSRERRGDRIGGWEASRGQRRVERPDWTRDRGERMQGWRAPREQRRFERPDRSERRERAQEVREAPRPREESRAWRNQEKHGDGSHGRGRGR